MVINLNQAQILMQMSTIFDAQIFFHLIAQPYSAESFIFETSVNSITVLLSCVMVLDPTKNWFVGVFAISRVCQK